MGGAKVLEVLGAELLDTNRPDGSRAQVLSDTERAAELLELRGAKVPENRLGAAKALEGTLLGVTG